MKPDGTDQKVLVSDAQVFDYDWSPDGKLIVYARGWTARSPASCSSSRPTAATPPKNVTRYATYNGDVTWSRTGNKIGFVSQRRGHVRAARASSLQKPGTPGAAGEIDWDDIHLRADRAAGIAAETAVISPNGSRSRSGTAATATTCGSPAATAAASPA